MITTRQCNNIYIIQLCIHAQLPMGNKVLQSFIVFYDLMPSFLHGLFVNFLITIQGQLKHWIEYVSIH